MNQIKKFLRKGIQKKEIFSAFIKLFTFIIGIFLFIGPFLFSKLYSYQIFQFLISVLGFITMFTVLSKKITNRNEFSMIKISLKNIYFIFLYLLFYISIIFLIGGLMFSFRNIEIIKFLLILAFSLAGITFVGVTLPGRKGSKKRYYLLYSSLFYLNSGLFFLLDMGSRMIEPVNPFSGKQIIAHNFLKDLTPELSIFGVFCFGIGLFFMFLLILGEIKDIKPLQRKSSKETLWKFFGLDELWKNNQKKF